MDAMTPAVRALVRLAYFDPELAGNQARKEGLYGAMLDHMQKVHKRLIYQTNLLIVFRQLAFDDLVHNFGRLTLDLFAINRLLALHRGRW